MAKSLAREVGTVFEGHREVTEKRRMHPQKRALIWVNAVGGTAVLASYAWNLVAHPEPAATSGGASPRRCSPGTWSACCSRRRATLHSPDSSSGSARRR